MDDYAKVFFLLTDAAFIQNHPTAILEGALVVALSSVVRHGLNIEEGVSDWLCECWKTLASYVYIFVSQQTTTKEF